MPARRAHRWQPRTSARGCRARPRPCRNRPAPDAFFDRFEEKRERALAGAVWDHHAQDRPARSSPATCGAHECSHFLGFEDLTRPAQSDRHLSASSSAGPWAVRRCSAEATSAVNTLPASDPSATWLSPAGRRGGRRRGARRDRVFQLGQVHAAHGDAGRGGDPDGGRRRRTPRCRAPVFCGRRRREAVAGATCRPVRSDLCARVAERRVGEPPQCLVGEFRRLQPGGERGHLECVVHEAPHEPGDDGISHGSRDGVVTGQQTAVGRGRMGAVEKPELATLERGHVLDELHADVGQRSQPVHRPDDPGAVSLRARLRPGRSTPIGRRRPPGRARSEPAPSGRPPSWGREHCGRSTEPVRGRCRSAASRTRARSMLPLSRRLSSDAKTGGAKPAWRRWARDKATRAGADVGRSEAGGSAVAS